ncbi:MAG: DUF2791 family P-loop domain-containing protein, partial [Pseudonocardia sp.]|nr:DUF2791 family P-loop domain-containing protein [Pseudonocardia sp.]
MEQLLCPRIVGRDGELRVVGDAVEAAARGAGRVVVVVGEAGSGKSRLLAQARARARDRGVRVLHGRVLEKPAGVPAGPFAEAVAGVLRAGLPADPALGPVRALLGRVAGEGGATDADGLSNPVAVAEAVLRLLQVCTRDGGAMLLIENLHWADPETVVALDYLVMNAADHGAGCLVALRPQGDPYRVARRWADIRAARLVELSPLPAAAVDRMVQLCMGADAVPAGLLAFVREGADGVPFFVEELLAGLLRTGALVPADRGWRVVERRLRATVPRTVAGAVTAGFTALHPRTQHVLHAASLLGRHIEWSVLPRVAQLEPDAVLTSLREATYAQFLIPDPDDGTLRFRHALTRDHIAALLLGPERGELARRGLAAIDDEHPDLPGPWCELAAELAEHAGDRGRAARLLVELAGRDRDRGALATAAARLERALELFGPADDTLPAREDLVTVRALAGDVDAALELGVPALGERTARAAGPPPRVALEHARGRALLVAGRHGEARARAARAAHAAGTSSAAATVLQAQIAVSAGDPHAAGAGARAVLDGPDLPPALACEAWEVLGRAARLHDVVAAERAFAAALDLADT